MAIGASLRPSAGVVPRLTFARSSAGRTAGAVANWPDVRRSKSPRILRSSSMIVSAWVFVIGSSARPCGASATTAPNAAVRARTVTNPPRIDLLLLS